ncbi:hypothetical protein PCE1_003533 [Barthelona sp. PCE]
MVNSSNTHVQDSFGVGYDHNGFVLEKDIGINAHLLKSNRFFDLECSDVEFFYEEEYFGECRSEHECFCGLRKISGSSQHFTSTRCLRSAGVSSVCQIGQLVDEVTVEIDYMVGEGSFHFVVYNTTPVSDDDMDVEALFTVKHENTIPDLSEYRLVDNSILVHNDHFCDESISKKNCIGLTVDEFSRYMEEDSLRLSTPLGTYVSIDPEKNQNNQYIGYDLSGVFEQFYIRNSSLIIPYGNDVRVQVTVPLETAKPSYSLHVPYIATSVWDIDEKNRPVLMVGVANASSGEQKMHVHFCTHATGMVEVVDKWSSPIVTGSHVAHLIRLPFLPNDGVDFICVMRMISGSLYDIDFDHTVVRGQFDTAQLHEEAQKYNDFQKEEENDIGTVLNASLSLSCGANGAFDNATQVCVCDEGWETKYHDEACAFAVQLSGSLLSDKKWYNDVDTTFVLALSIVFVTITFVICCKKRKKGV